MPLFILAGGELVLLFLGARIAWWVLRTRGSDAPRPARPAGGGASLRALPGTEGAGSPAAQGSLRKAA